MYNISSYSRSEKFLFSFFNVSTQLFSFSFNEKLLRLNEKLHTCQLISPLKSSDVYDAKRCARNKVRQFKQSTALPVYYTLFFYFYKTRRFKQNLTIHFLFIHSLFSFCSIFIFLFIHLHLIHHEVCGHRFHQSEQEF